MAVLVGGPTSKASTRVGLNALLVFFQRFNLQPNRESWMPREIHSCHNNQQTIISQRVEKRGPKNKWKKELLLEGC